MVIVMKTTALTLIVLARGAGAYDNLRGDTAPSVLSNIIAELTSRIGNIEQELEELRNHRKLQSECELTFMEASGECLLSRTMTLNPAMESGNAAMPALKVYGDTLLFDSELVVESKATFRNDVAFEGVDKTFEVVGTAYLHSDFEVDGYTTLHSDVVIEKKDARHDHEHEQYQHFLHDNKVTNEPGVLLWGKLIVEEDVLFESDFYVEGDVTFSKQLEVRGDCIGC